MSRRRRVWFPRTRAFLARCLRPLFLRWPWVRGRRWWQRRLTPSLDQVPVGQAVAMRHGLKLQLFEDPVFREPWLFGEFEPVETRFFQQFVQPGDTVIDVGANFGWHTLVCARKAGPSGRVLAFEPIPTNVERATAHLALNGLADRVTLHPVALGAEAKTLEIYTFSGGSLSESSASTRGRDDAQPQQVEQQRLDALVPADAAPTFMKIDVEGFELDVLRGGAQLLRRADAPVVVFEVCLSYAEHGDSTPQNLEALMRDYGYTEFWRMESRRGTVPCTTLQWSGDPDHVNFIAAKPPAVERVRAAL